MPSMKVIKRRISSVTSTQQIMKAMDLVATSKLQKAKMRMDAARPLFSETKRIVDELKNREDTAENIFVKQREVKNTAYIVITSDRGLCGGYNANISKKVLQCMGANKNEKIICIGLKGWEFFRRRGRNILKKYVGMSETAFYEDAEMIGSLIASLYNSGEIDEVYVGYTRFESILSHVPHVEKILPIDGGLSTGKDSTMEYEPDANVFLNNAVPMYLSIFIYGAMVESASCEQAARMVSMDSAANNATEIIDDLSLMYNRIRQGAITQEINEIVSGANAQK